MYEDILEISKAVKLDVTDGTYSISMPKGLDEKDLYKAMAFVLSRTLVVMTQESWQIEFKSLDDHVVFNVKKALE